MEESKKDKEREERKPKLAGAKRRGGREESKAKQSKAKRSKAKTKKKKSNVGGARRAGGIARSTSVDLDDDTIEGKSISPEEDLEALPPLRVRAAGSDRTLSREEQTRVTAGRGGGLG